MAEAGWHFIIVRLHSRLTKNAHFLEFKGPAFTEIGAFSDQNCGERDNEIWPEVAYNHSSGWPVTVLHVLIARAREKFVSVPCWLSVFISKFGVLRI